MLKRTGFSIKSLSKGWHAINQTKHKTIRKIFLKTRTAISFIWYIGTKRSVAWVCQENRQNCPSGFATLVWRGLSSKDTYNMVKMLAVEWVLGDIVHSLTDWQVSAFLLSTKLCLVLHRFRVAYNLLGHWPNESRFGLVWFLCLMAYQLFLGYLMPRPFS